MAALDPADVAARLLRRPLTPARLHKFVYLCRTEARWEAALAAMPDAVIREQVRTATARLMQAEATARVEYPS